MKLRQIKKQAYAVSPVIATLMLVLVSVGSAGAFYVWQNGWADDVTDSVGGADVKATLKVGGSSTVWEFTSIAKEIFEAQNPNYKIELQKGGSGSGISGAGWGILDVGASSKGTSSLNSALAKLPDLDRDNNPDIGLTMKTHLIAYDGVALVVPAANTHGLKSVNATTLQTMYSGDPLWSSINTNSGGTTACTGTTEVVVTYDRSEDSGTEENFCKKLLQKGGQLPYVDGATTYGADESVTSNQALLDSLAEDADGFGFMSFGMIDDSVVMVGYDTAGDGTAIANATADTIADLTWAGSRPLNLITIGEPTGAAKVFIDFCLMSEMNQLLAEQSGYESIY